MCSVCMVIMRCQKTKEGSQYTWAGMGTSLCTIPSHFGLGVTEQSSKGEGGRGPSVLDCSLSLPGYLFPCCVFPFAWGFFLLFLVFEGWWPVQRKWTNEEGGLDKREIRCHP